MSLVRNENSLVGRQAFYDEEVFKVERRKVFERSWIFVAHESEIRDPGDYVTRHVGSDQVIVVRDEDGEPRVMLNSCRHRGAALCDADKGNASHFRCSYHGWLYKNNGNLQGVPRGRDLYGPGLDRGRLGLTNLRVGVFAGLIFATWSETEPPIREALGDIAWYLEAVLGKSDYEVTGSPGQMLAHMNWKVGVENFGGDFYHLMTTHKIPLEVGAAGSQFAWTEKSIVEQLGGVPDKSAAGHYLVHSRTGGHTGAVTRSPYTFEKPTFVGHETHLWPEFEERLTPDQVAFRTGLNLFGGSIFPNLSIMEMAALSTAEGEPPVTWLHLRQWHPLAADQTRIMSWSLVPKGASQAWKEQSHRIYIRELGFGGSFETDDYNNFANITRANQGGRGMLEESNYEGKQLPEAEDVSWPGAVYHAEVGDVTFRSMYAHWAEMMEAE